VQQPADVTYRLYDYGRPRELHLDDGVAVSNAAPYADARSGHARTSGMIVRSPHFWLAYCDGDRSPELPGGPVWLVPLSGDGVGKCLLLPSIDAFAGWRGSPCLIAGTT
jgi:mannose-6-phosphate isomerase